MITAAAAYCNNEVNYLAWTIGAKIPGCLGFEVTCVYLNADGSVVVSYQLSATSSTASTRTPRADS